MKLHFINSSGTVKNCQIRCGLEYEGKDHPRLYIHPPEVFT